MKWRKGYTKTEVVSTDSPRESADFRARCQGWYPVGTRPSKVVSWYDNEMGYSSKVPDLIATSPSNLGCAIAKLTSGQMAAFCILESWTLSECP